MPNSIVGTIQITPSLFTQYGQSCSSVCAESRYLTCNKTRCNKLSWHINRRILTSLVRYYSQWLIYIISTSWITCSYKKPPIDNKHGSKSCLLTRIKSHVSNQSNLKMNYTLDVERTNYTERDREILFFYKIFISCKNIFF